MLLMKMLRVRRKDPEATVVEMFSNWLRSGKVAGLLVPAVSKLGIAVPVLFSDPERVDNVHPFLPVMKVNGASIVAEIAGGGSSGVRIGVVLKPCEMRGVVELIKLQQVARENLLLIGVDCPGTYKLEKVKAELNDSKGFVRNFLMEQGRYLNEPNFRTACQMCEFSVPLVYDLAIGFLGLDPGQELILTAATELGVSLLDGLETVDIAEPPKARVDYLSELSRIRQQQAVEKIAEFDRHALGPERLVKYFADCLNCHNCMKVCPVCYCRQCFFESEVFDRELDDYVRVSRRKGLNRMPAGTMLYHLTRMNHMMTSCVQCGICEESCPVGIGLTVLYKKVSRNAQAEFNYLSGRSLDEPLPLTTFREDEFREIGEE